MTLWLNCQLLIKNCRYYLSNYTYKCNYTLVIIADLRRKYQAMYTYKS